MFFQRETGEMASLSFKVNPGLMGVTQQPLSLFRKEAELLVQSDLELYDSTLSECDYHVFMDAHLYLHVLTFGNKCDVWTQNNKCFSEVDTPGIVNAPLCHPNESRHRHVFIQLHCRHACYLSSSRKVFGL